MINKKIEVKCNYLNEYGQGVFNVGKIFFSCSNFLPKEIAIVEIDNHKCKIIRLIKKSDKRAENICTSFARCGSCHLLHMNYIDQIKVKKQYFLNAFKEYKLNCDIDEFMEASSKTSYRNKMQIAFRYKDKELVYGFYEEETHKIVTHDFCIVHSNEQNEIAKEITKLLKEFRIPLYNENKRIGIIRNVVIRETKLAKEKQILVTIVTNGYIFPGCNEFLKKLRMKCPYITTIVQNINNRKTNIILGDEEKILFGKGYITDILCGLSFNISSKTFYQINPFQTEVLYNKVIELAGVTNNDIVIDSYCGVGTIGAIISKNAKFVIGVESNKQSVLNARINASFNNLKNIKFVNADASDYLDELSKENQKIDILIMDPPREGSSEKFLKAIKKLKPRKVLYVSCDAKTLARDISILASDYKMIKKVLVDLFVHTYHVETVVSLELK